MERAVKILPGYNQDSLYRINPLMFPTMEQQSILALVSDSAQEALLSAWRTDSGLDVEQHNNLVDFTQAVENKPTFLVIVGWMSDAREQSADTLSQVKEMVGESTRVIILADTNNEQDVVDALHIGADRYITIDCPPKIFDARMKAVLRRVKPDQGFQHFPPYIMNQMTREVRFEDKHIQLTPREFRIAQYLFENRDQVLSREALLRDIWELPDLKYKRRVDTKMSHVRRKMCLDGSYGWQLRFPRGKGYQLNKQEEVTG